MEESYGYEYSRGEEKKKTVGTYIGKALKFIGIGIIVFIYGFFIIRIITSQDPGAIKGFVWNQTALDAYNASPESFAVENQEISSFYNSDGLTDGLFRINEAKYVKSIGQLQVAVRYNNSTLKTVAAEYGLESLPSGENFIYILTDANGNEYTDYSFKALSKNVYNYRQLIFDGVDYESAGTLTVEMYYVGDVDKTKGPIASILIYDEDRQLGKTEAVELDAPKGVTSGFSANPAYLVKGE